MGVVRRVYPGLLSGGGGSDDITKSLEVKVEGSRHGDLLIEQKLYMAAQKRDGWLRLALWVRGSATIPGDGITGSQRQGDGLSQELLHCLHQLPGKSFVF